MTSRHSITRLTQMAYDYGHELEELVRHAPHVNWHVIQAKTSMRKIVEDAQDHCYTPIASGDDTYYTVAYHLSEIFHNAYGRIEALTHNQAVAA